MAKPPKKKTDEIRDEPGAEQRFRGILRKALNTPPPRKQGMSKGKAKKAEGRR
jgi:hypothetical protein